VATVLVVWFDAYVFAHYQPAQGGEAERVLAARPIVSRGPAGRAELIRGLRYLHGTGVAIDNVRAKLWVERAALRGDPVAENLMGVFAQSGSGASMVRAIGWYEAAVRHGNVKAMTNLGKLYAGGWREGTDFAKAAGWFAKAAAAGDVDAAFNLAVLCESGLGRPRNIAEAYRWYAIAAGSGDKHAGARATVLAGQITPEEREALDHAILAFKPLPIERLANDVPRVTG
jgi:localization factor PodJL